MSSFEINCTVSGETPDNLSHECGVTKSLTWTGNGTHSGLSFYLIRSQLSDLKPSYVYKIPKVSKLLKFIFTPISPNIGSTKVKVRVKYNVDGVLTILDEYDLGNISTQTTKYHKLLMDINSKAELEGNHDKKIDILVPNFYDIFKYVERICPHIP